MPPPASNMLVGQRMVVAAGVFRVAGVLRISTIGVRPNSPPQTISVESSRPRCFRSLISAAVGWSVMSQFFFRSRFRSVCWSQLACISMTKRTPRSTMRRASRQLVANGRVGSLLDAVHLERARGSFEKSSSSGAAICMRNASSYDAMRDAISTSPVSA